MYIKTVKSSTQTFDVVWSWNIEIDSYRFNRIECIKFNALLGTADRKVDFVMLRRYVLFVFRLKSHICLDFVINGLQFLIIWEKWMELSRFIIQMIM